MQSNDYTRAILDSLVERSESFLKEEMDIQILSVTQESSSPPKVKLQTSTTMISVSGSLEMLITMGYDNNLLEKLIEVFLEGEEIEEDEIDEIKESVSSEIVNIIVGNALFNPIDKSALHISPPILIYEAKFLFKHKDSKIAITKITTNFGEMLLTTIMPEMLSSIQTNKE